ncbi:MAG: prepilin-type N-terminal cleavage/methylation domain-containing protein [Deltaproteobacteria bacterium]|nr:prepilin-type N-terminal cleavage/methylation domain-containing protein [Deltaproteobacteria bacterium]
MKERTGRGGYTLVEIAMAVAILGILVMLAISSFSDLRVKYGMEAETKELYAYLMDARGRSMQRSRFHFVRFTPNGYATYEDTNPLPDGNRQYDAGSDNQVAGGTVNYPVVSFLSATGTQDNVIFNRHGEATGTGYILISPPAGSSVNPDYDCISIAQTRMRTGRYSSAGGGSCVEK